MMDAGMIQTDFDVIFSCSGSSMELFPRSMRLLGCSGRGCLGVYRCSGRGRSNDLKMTISECEVTLVGIVGVDGGRGGWGRAAREVMPTPGTMLV